MWKRIVITLLIALSIVWVYSCDSKPDEVELERQFGAD